MKRKKMFSNFTKLCLVITGFFFFSFFSSNQVYASVWLEQPVNSTVGKAQLGSLTSQMLGTDLPISTFDSIELYIDASSTQTTTDVNVSFSICVAGGSSEISCGSGGVGTSTAIETLPIGFQGYKTFYLDSATTTVANRYYNFSINTSNNASTSIGASNNANTYTNDSGFDYCTTLSTGDCLIADYYFKIGNDLPALNPDGNFIDIVIPIDGTAITDFLSFSVQYSITTATSTNLYACVKYGTTTQGVATLGGTPSQIDCTNIPNNSAITGFNNTFQIGKTNHTPIGEYFAKAYIIGTNTSYLFASSSIISYAQTNADGGIFINDEDVTGPLGTATSTTGFSNLEKILQLFKTSFPFNIFFGLQNTLLQETNEAREDLGAPTAITLSLGFLGNYTFALDLENIVGTSTKTLIFTIQGYIIWLIFGYKLYKKIV